MDALYNNNTLSGGFASPAIDAAHGFRAAMQAMARPGSWQDIAGANPPAGISEAAGTLLLTLCDPETGLFLADDLDSQPLRDWIAFHTGAPIVSAEHADFALGGWMSLHPLSQFAIGTPEYPDHSATLIVEVEGFDVINARLSGPGIKDESLMALPEISAFQENSKRYPLGLDFFFTAGSKLAALPRSTCVMARD